MTLRQTIRIRSIARDTALVLLALPSSGLLGCGGPAKAGPEGTPRPLPVTSVLPVPADRVALERRYHGELVPHRSSALSFTRSERIEALLVEAGATVTAGQLLAVLDQSALEAQRAALDARRRIAAARLAELEAGPREEQERSAQARVEELKARLAAGELTAQRLGALADGDHGSRESADLASREAQALAAQLDGAQATLDELLNGTRREVLDQAAAELSALAFDVARLDAELDRGRLHAPFDGRVAELLLEVGAVPQPGLPVMRVIESGALEAWIGMPPEVLSALEARVLSGDGSEPFTLEIAEEVVPARWIGSLPELDRASRTRTAIFALDADHSRRLAAGQLAKLSWVRDEPLSGLWIPADALIRSGQGLWAVYALVQASAQGSGATVTRLERREVVLVHDGGERLLVRGLIDANTPILASGVQRAVAGQTVVATLEELPR